MHLLFCILAVATLSGVQVKYFSGTLNFSHVILIICNMGAKPQWLDLQNTLAYAHLLMISTATISAHAIHCHLWCIVLHGSSPLSGQQKHGWDCLFGHYYAMASHFVQGNIKVLAKA